MWSLYDNGKFLEPLKFSNGKTQEDVVKEVLDEISKGKKIIFIHGVCGTGKSAIALNIAKKLGKSSVVVPGKNLQSQYKRDYEGSKYLLKENGEKLKINVITGRNNHKCKFLEDNASAIPKFKKEVNLKLHDIFAEKREKVQEMIANDKSADNMNIPCKIEIKEKNFYKIKEYLRQNKNVDMTKIDEIGDVKRVPLASVCPYWSPVLPEKYELGKGFENSKKRKYKGLKDTTFVIYRRKEGCPFYEQFNHFIDSDVIVFNSMKYNLESAINRKPLTEVEIIDECDEFLDGFSNQRNINLDRFQNSLIQVFSDNEDAEKTRVELLELVKHLKNDRRIQTATFSGQIISLKETSIYDIFRVLIDSGSFLEEIDDESYIFDVENSAKMFEEFFEETYVTFSKKENNLIASVVTTNLAKKFKEMVDKNKIIILMSGTLHSSEVLKEIFGLEDFKIIGAETTQQGQIDVVRTGLEFDCRYSNLNGNGNREKYLKSLSRCIEIAEKPALVHVNGFVDLPSEYELKEFDIDNLISRDKLQEMQNEDKTGKMIDLFKDGKTNVLFSTKSSRGVDFPGEQCRSIIFTKYPNPNVQDAFWKILKQTNPNSYWDFYKDKARRELWQRVYRGLRFKEDHVFVLSPDIRVLEAFEAK